ncbi:vomeronasal type-2 receptor 26-like [Pleurodeles waltl]|uniref:vomeronasal type-2 receptor 26-like n=1 Tax=Pleurodeles waltl TaxID=8319 RepID=UPI0037093E8A
MPTDSSDWSLLRASAEGLTRSHGNMGTPTDARYADFWVPSQKGTTDSGAERKEFSRRTPPGEEEKETPRQEKTEADDAQENQGGRAEGESRGPETSIFRHDPGGSWLNKLNKFLMETHFQTPDGDSIMFDETGDMAANYDILNWVKFPNGSISGIKVGSYDFSAPPDHQLTINESSIIWHSEGPNLKQIPRSVCSESCLPGYRKASIEGRPICCFDCVPCAEGEFSNGTDVENCLKCPEDRWPNTRRDSCIPKTIAFLSYNDIIGVILVFIAVFFSIATAAVLGIFIRHRDTPIVRANNRDLSYALLLSLMLSFLCSLLFIGRPKAWTCLIQQVIFGIIFTVAVSCVLAKTITVVIAFNATRPGSRLSRWLGSRVSISIVLLSTVGQLTICLSWLLTAPPHPVTDTQSEAGRMILLCDQGSITAFYSVIGYMGLLAFASFIVAFLARNLPDRFNEAKLITFSMLVFCSVWVSFIPAYLSTKGRNMVIMEIFAILASSAGLLGCIFIPKCYIILFRVDANTREPFVLRSWSRSSVGTLCQLEKFGQLMVPLGEVVKSLL